MQKNATTDTRLATIAYSIAVAPPSSRSSFVSIANSAGPLFALQPGGQRYRRMRLKCHANSSLIGHPGVTIINCGIFALGSAPPLQDAYFAKLLGGSTALSGIAGAVLEHVRLAVDPK